MKDIKVICECGKDMVKGEDGRKETTKHNKPDYPSNQMDFQCPCGKTVTVVWLELEQGELLGMRPREDENLD